MRGLFISGSGTSVGKTFVAQQLVKVLAKSQKVRVRKPVESGCQNQNGRLIPKDAQLLSVAANNLETIDTVCAYPLAKHASAELASENSGTAIGLEDLVNACVADDFVVVEGAGGLYSPIAKQTLNSDLASVLALPLVLVVKDELGAVNQALLCLQAAEKQKLTVAMLVLNQITSNTLNNARAIKQYSSAAIVEFNTNNLARFDAVVCSLVT